MKILLLGILLGQLSMMSTASVGAGAHGYDWIIGSWTCHNAMPSEMGGPTTQTFAARRIATGAIMFRALGTGFDETGYVAYAANTRTWWAAYAYANGSYGGESTKDTGAKATWTGSMFDAASRRTITIRDLYTIETMNKYRDVTQIKAGLGWRTVFDGICTKA